MAGVKTRWWSLGTVLVLAACQPPEVSVAPPEEAGPRPSLELSDSVVMLGEAPLRFRERVRREGILAIRLNDAAEPVELEVRARAPGCVGTECLAQTLITLEPGVWLQVPVALQLSSLGRVTSVISFSSPARSVAAVSAELIATGTAAPDCLEVEVGSVDFGTLERGCPVKQRHVRLTNACAIPRFLNDVDVVPRTAPFSVSQLISLPRRLAPGESWVGLIEFLGGDLGTHEADLHFQVDGALGAIVSLDGERTEDGPRQWSFSSPSARFDLLIVLDSSPSFVTRRASVERQILEDVTNPGWFAGPLRVGVVGTSGPSLVWGPATPFFENGDFDFESALQDALGTLPPGNEVEQCLGAAAQVSDTANFWRMNSRRLAVCITDAPDQTLGPSNAIARLEDAGVEWHVIGPPFVSPGPACEVEGLDDGIHLAGTSALDGSVISICEADWHLPTLPLVPPMPLTYRLPVTPNFPIDVFVDGQELPPSDWVWDVPTRTLTVGRRPQQLLLVVEAQTCSP